MFICSPGRVPLYKTRILVLYKAQDYYRLQVRTQNFTDVTDMSHPKRM